jgi:hypothetical protein
MQLLDIPHESNFDVNVVPKHLNFAMFSEDLLAIFML